MDGQVTYAWVGIGTLPYIPVGPGTVWYGEKIPLA